MKSQCWNIPASERFGPALIIIHDEQGLRTLDDSPEGSHPITDSELLRMNLFKISLSRALGKDAGKDQ